ncbi:glycoside hydrolase family 79 protein [Collybiopsis luxurians FD-317 M1]|nr:glycoside hydrolase family 79 protein [Collybiopsis luxurians FD-317 M1]
MFVRRVELILVAAYLAASVDAITVPTVAPSTAATIDSSLVAVSLEFFAFPGYTELVSTGTCLANLQALRGSPVAVRIGGTTQDRATYNASLATPVSYTVASPSDAPTSLTFGPSFFTLAASDLKGNVTIGLNRQLNNQANTLAAAVQAKKSMPNLYAIELGNEPDLYASNSPIVPSTGWNQNADAASEKSWFTALAPSLGNIFQAAVYISWRTAPTIPLLGTSISNVRSVSEHSYPQSACNGASTNLQTLMSHSSIVSYTAGFKADAASAHAAGVRYFLGETNSATCGGGGISPTFGAALWIVDYVLQGALNGAERLYFHQGTIGNCQYCWWGRFTTGAPFYGAYFVSQFLGTDGAKLEMLDNGTGAVASYVLFNSAGTPVRLLVYNSNYFDGTGTRSSTSVSFTGGGIPSSGTKTALRLTGPNATSRVDEGGIVTIGAQVTFDGNCNAVGTPIRENVAVTGGTLTISVQASEALIVFL